MNSSNELKFAIQFMHRLFLSILLVLMIASVTYGQQRGARWARFSSIEGRFSILLPSKPIAEVDNYGLSVIHSFTADTDWVTYVISFVDYKSAIPDPEQALDGGRDALILSTNSRLLSESKISLDGYPGRELNILTPRAIARDTTRLYVVGNRVYMVRVIVTPPNRDISKAKETFFLSFRLTAKPSGSKRRGHLIANR